MSDKSHLFLPMYCRGGDFTETDCCGFFFPLFLFLFYTGTFPGLLPDGNISETNKLALKFFHDDIKSVPTSIRRVTSHRQFEFQQVPFELDSIIVSRASGSVSRVFFLFVFNVRSSTLNGNVQPLTSCV